MSIDVPLSTDIPTTESSSFTLPPEVIPSVEIDTSRNRVILWFGGDGSVKPPREVIRAIKAIGFTAWPVRGTHHRRWFWSIDQHLLPPDGWRVVTALEHGELISVPGLTDREPPVPLRKIRVADVYEALIQRIVTLLKEGKGRAIWHQPWVGASVPTNALTGHRYSGFNALFLNFSMYMNHYRDNYWLGASQVAQLGGTIHEGSIGEVILVPLVIRVQSDSSRSQQPTPSSESSAKHPADGPIVDDSSESDVDEPTPATASRLVFRPAMVYNIAQCDLPPDVLARLTSTSSIQPPPIHSAEQIIRNMPNPPEIRVGGGRATYIPSDDVILVPEPSRFSDMAHYYMTLFHELVHSTGHKSRLNRSSLQHSNWSSHEYSIEEVIAEIGAATLMRIAGAAPPDYEEQSSTYIAHWLSAIEKRPSIIVFAIREAQRAVDYILSSRPDTAS